MKILLALVFTVTFLVAGIALFWVIAKWIEWCLGLSWPWFLILSPMGIGVCALLVAMFYIFLMVVSSHGR